MSWPTTGAASARSSALPCGKPFDDVDQHDVGEAGLGDALGDGRADVAGADDGDLGTCHDPIVSAARHVPSLSSCLARARSCSSRPP